MDRDWRVGLETLGEVVALEHAGHRVARRQFDQSARPQGVTPLCVVANLGACFVQHQAGLRVIGARVVLDLLTRQGRTGRISTRGVTNHCGEVADQEDHLMPEVLQLAHLVEHDGMPEVQVGRGRVQSQLDAQGHTAGLASTQLGHPGVLGQQFTAATQAHGQGMAEGVTERFDLRCVNGHGDRRGVRGFSQWRDGVDCYTSQPCSGRSAPISAPRGLGLDSSGRPDPFFRQRPSASRGAGSFLGSTLRLLHEPV